MTLGLGKDGGGGISLLGVEDSVRKGPLGTACGRKGKSFIEFITGPTFLPVCPGS